MQSIKVLALCFISVVMTSVSMAAAESAKIEGLPAEFYSRQVQPVFDNRCLACHSCFNAPCQLNLQNYEGFQRGANKLNVYNGLRLKSVDPTRMWIDAHGTQQWRKKEFFEVNTSKKTDENLFLSMLKLRVAEPDKMVKVQVAASMVCPDSMQSLSKAASGSPELGMPYGFPALSAQEMNVLETWIKNGAPGPSAAEEAATHQFSVETQNQIKQWEKFLNTSTKEQRLVSRYIYEHLFLAHIYFPHNHEQFFRLVRSRTACGKNVQEIATRRPNDDPGTKNFQYCLTPFPGTVVMKTHIPYEWSPAKLERYKGIFWETKWKAVKVPGYEAGVAENPFIAFQDLPVKARYRFLLEDAHFQISTFIKGPVCNGSNAVNSIQEQFYVFFLDPKSDNMTLSAEFAQQVKDLLVLPGVFGSDVSVTETGVFYKKLIDHRERYRNARVDYVQKTRPEGYLLQDIWDGDGNNPNAALTVFRHDDNAVVLKGAVGDLSKTVFMLDYPLFERLVYNLVVNFDVFGNVSHQLLTRVYMDMIRMEAEELFLSFLPPEQRLEYRRAWYQGLLAQAKMTYIFPTIGSSEPTAVRFNNDDKDTKKQMVEKVLFYRLNEKTRGALDVGNWKRLTIPESITARPGPDRLRSELFKIASVVAVDKTPFARFFPDIAYLKVNTGDGGFRVFSLVHNKEHENISWILAESLRMNPKEDSLTIHEGYLGPYPNMIFDVKEADVATFVKQVQKMKSAEDYQKLVTSFGVRRTQNTFWVHYDELTAHFRKTDPVNFGFLDLTRYELK